MHYRTHRLGAAALACALLSACAGSSPSVPPAKDEPKTLDMTSASMAHGAVPVSGCSVKAATSVNPNGAALTAISAVNQGDMWYSAIQPANGTFGTLYVERYPAESNTSLQPFAQAVSGASLKAFSDSDIWVAAQAVSGGNLAGNEIVHWNGSSWRTVPVTGQDASGFYVRAITGLSPKDVWFAGAVEAANSKNASVVYLALAHWNGSALTIVAVSPYAGTVGQVATELSPTNVIAVSSSDDTGHAPVAQWNGVRWTFHELPAVPGQTDNGIIPTQIAGTDATNIWVVGYNATHTSIYGRIWKYNGNWQPYLYTGAVQVFDGVVPLDANRTVVTGLMPNSSATTTEAYSGTDRFAPVSNTIQGGVTGPSAPVPGSSLFWVPSASNPNGNTMSLVGCQ